MLLIIKFDVSGNFEYTSIPFLDHRFRSSTSEEVVLNALNEDKAFDYKLVSTCQVADGHKIYLERTSKVRGDTSPNLEYTERGMLDFQLKCWAFTPNFHPSYTNTYLLLEDAIDHLYSLGWTLEQADAAKKYFIFKKENK